MRRKYGGRERPPKPEGILARYSRQNMGRSRPQNVFSRVRFAGGVHGLVPELSSACLAVEVEPRAEPWVEGAFPRIVPLPLRFLSIETWSRMSSDSGSRW